MIAKAVYKHGQVSVTDAQEKKHISQMTKSEIKAINNKVIIPTDEELERNPRSRSAKLRIAEKL